MLERHLKDVLDLSDDLQLIPHKREYGTDWTHPKDNETFKLVDAEGNTQAIIDAWCIEDACFGYVEYDATGHNFVHREVFRLVPFDNGAPGRFPLPGHGQATVGP